MDDVSKAGGSTPALSRRDFLKASAISATSAALMAAGGYSFAQGNGKLRVGVVGCGGRGTGAAINAMNAHPDVEVVALGDLFRDRLESSLATLKADAEKNADHARKFKVTPERCFVGWNAYQQVIDSGIDIVILATPPGFRPAHLRAAVEAGKHVFMEKPVAVDAPGIRSVLESSEIARRKNLGIVAGTQRRHQNSYRATMERIHAGDIGEIVAAQCYWNQGGLWMHERRPEWTDMEWQLRNWLYFTWLSGDHIVEQHVHNIDVINWAMRAHPEKAMGMGGRQVRTDPAYGHIYDHFCIEFEYPNGARVMSMCRQIDGCANNVSERVVGTRGTSNCNGMIRGAVEWKYEGPNNSPYDDEHKDLILSIKEGQPLNEGVQIAESCLSAIMGRMAAYTGQVITWEQALNSQEDLTPPKLEFGPLPVPPVAMPGQTKFV
jgi:predicted dehydrogenase